MRFGSFLGIACFLLVASPAGAEGICDPLIRLITDPPSGFIAYRAEPIEPQYWTSKPLLPQGKCKVWASLMAEAHNVRCTANDDASPAVVTAYFEDTRRTIDLCLMALPNSAKFERRANPVNTEGLKGAETSWVYDTATARLKINLTDYLRVTLGSSYNSFAVEYLKY